MNPTPPAGAPPNGQPHGAQTTMRKKARDTLFRPASDPARKRLGPRPPPQANGHLGTPSQLVARPLTPNSHRAASPAVQNVPEAERVSGFSDPRITAEGIQYRDYKLVTTRKDLLDGLRYHILQLTGGKQLDIRSESDFTKPARLHRRDPRAVQPGPVKEEVEEQKDGLNAVEREELNKRKEQRQKEREANLAQIAPSQNVKRMNVTKKKVQQVYSRQWTEEEKQRIQTNYEEKLPWHLEDFDNKHCFIGKNQVGSTGVHAAFLFEPAVDASTGKFRLVPIEKFYKFEPKKEVPKVVMTIEEIEAAMKKRGSEPDWLLRQRESRLAEKSRELLARQSKGLFSGAQDQGIAGRMGEEADLDFEDDFADDEEGNIFEDKDEDTKLAEKKIKEDQLQANFLDFKDLKEYDVLEEREKREEEARKKFGKSYKRALEKREQNYNHGSDSEYSSNDSDSEAERQRLEREKIANVKKEEDGDSKNLSSGTNTPSGRAEKKPIAPEQLQVPSRKRPGSPNLSDASGTDASSRKKKLKSKHSPSSQPTPGPSRPISPANVPAIARHRGGAGGSPAGSDTEGGAMSDGSSRRLKLTMTNGASGTNTPRAGSPIPRPSSTVPAPIPFPSEQDIRNAIPSEGIATKDLMAKVAHPKDRRTDFIQLVRKVAKLDNEKKVLLLKEQS